MCCPTCACLGFCPEFVRNEPGGYSDNLITLIIDRDRHEFVASSRAGCHYCGLVCEAFALLGSNEIESSIDIRIYQRSPTEIAISKSLDVAAVEVYLSAGM